MGGKRKKKKTLESGVGLKISTIFEFCYYFFKYLGGWRRRRRRGRGSFKSNIFLEGNEEGFEHSGDVR